MTRLIEAVEMCTSKEEILKDDIKKLESLNENKTLRFVIINASDNPANERYIKGKVQDGESVGLNVKVAKFDKDCTTDDILDVVNKCKNGKVPVIFQLPSYDHLDVDEILETISYDIDADGFTNKWLGELMLGNDNNISPATPKGVMNLLEYENIDLEGKNVLVIGKSNHVGKPLTVMMMNKGATVINANSKTKDLPSLIRISDIIISCVGKPNLIKPEDVKEGSVLIGVGFTYVNGKQILDYDIDEIVKDGKASIVSNRIRCTGKSTINALIENVVNLYKMNLK